MNGYILGMKWKIVIVNTYVYGVCILLASVMLLHIPMCEHNAHQHILLSGVPIIFISLFPYTEHFV